MSEMEYPLTLFRFHVVFQPVGGASNAPNICEGSFSECTGLDATMEPKVIKSGGANYGAAQRVGQVTFGTVVLKRGMTTNRGLWQAFSKVTEQAKPSRFTVKIYALKPAGNSMFEISGLQDQTNNPERNAAFTVTLTRALTIKFKCGDLNARATEIGVEELHLAHEGLSIA
jgi:phage tail-like protein